MTLMVVCTNPNCKKEFPSMIQLDQGSFQTATITDNSQQCQHCNKMITYSKENMKFR
ncbi:hypothetical protein ACIQX3_21475 [Peribacillus frigoritolerans]|uniref:hypothetical protein n=1 Tax=Peribacillus frigoritolerans TaxID=450367 RepID=UPI0038125DEC